MYRACALLITALCVLVLTPAPLFAQESGEEAPIVNPFEATPAEGEATATEGVAAPEEGEATPAEGEATATEGEVPPEEGEAVPAEGEAAPAEGEAAPTEGEEGLVDEATDTEDAGEPMTVTILPGGDLTGPQPYAYGRFELSPVPEDELSGMEVTAFLLFGFALPTLATGGVMLSQDEATIGGACLGSGAALMMAGGALFYWADSSSETEPYVIPVISLGPEGGLVSGVAHF